MRGKDGYAVDPETGERITPAYAGKSIVHGPVESVNWDHPRVCGEKLLSIELIKLIMGSPPRMRGKGLTAFRQSRRMGITPAYAGKSTAAVSVTPYDGDHPRVCGEKTKKIP